MAKKKLAYSPALGNQLTIWEEDDGNFSIDNGDGICVELPNSGGSGQPTNITSTDLIVGGADYSRTINFNQTTKDELTKANIITTTGAEDQFLCADGTYKQVGSGGGQPTTLTSLDTRVPITGSGTYDMTIDTRGITGNLAWSPYNQIFNGGSATFRIGQITAGLTEVEFKYGIVGTQSSSSGNPKITNLSVLSEIYLPTHKAWIDPAFTNDVFYTYAVPDTNVIEIWVQMLGGYTRTRNLSYRVLRGTFDPTISSGSLPTDAVPFTSKQVVTTFNGQSGPIIADGSTLDLNGQGKTTIADAIQNIDDHIDSLDGTTLYTDNTKVTTLDTAITACLHKTGNEDIAGTKTVIETGLITTQGDGRIQTNFVPTLSNDVTNKAYVDGLIEPTDTLIYITKNIHINYTGKTIRQWVEGQDNVPTIPSHFKVQLRLISNNATPDEIRVFHYEIEVDDNLSTDFQVTNYCPVVFVLPPDSANIPYGMAYNLHFSNDTTAQTFINKSSDTIFDSSGYISMSAGKGIRSSFPITILEMRVFAINDNI